jgi:hypothetical protein
MKLSKNTISILQNFSNLNQSIKIAPGSILTTRNLRGTVQARAEIDETFPETVPIYDLSKFITALNIMNSPSLTFHKNKMILTDDNGRKMNYYYSEESLIREVPSAFPSSDVVLEFEWTSEQIATLNKVAATIGATTLTMTTDDKNAIVALVHDPKTPNTNTYTIPIASTSSVSFSKLNLSVSIENIRPLLTQYTVSIANITTKNGTKVRVLDLVSEENNNIRYIIAAEAGSIIEEMT